MYTTACDHCRRSRVRCERQENGQIPDEVCERCRKSGIVCTTTKRHVGRLRGAKNKRSSAGPSHTVQTSSVGSSSAAPSVPVTRFAQVMRPPVAGISQSDGEHLPNPLHVLASEAYHREPVHQGAEHDPSSYDHPFRNSQSVLNAFSEWSTRISNATGRDNLMHRIDRLLANASVPAEGGLEQDNMVFHGRVDMPRPDAAPEDDVISLQIISLQDAQHLFDSFMRLITNGSMYFDPRIHNLAFVRTRSSFLLAVILSIASSYKLLSPSALLHERLQRHVARLEVKVWEQQFKSIEIIQGLLLLASWSEVPTTLSRDKTWAYISHALSLAVEMRIDTAMPYYVQMDPILTVENRALLVRNAHRCCMLLYIHDRVRLDRSSQLRGHSAYMSPSLPHQNMAMVAGRYPILPESSIFSDSALSSWGQHPLAYHYDASLCASVALRKLVTAVRDGLDIRTSLTDSIASIDNTLEDWRRRWEAETASTKEYDIISRFSTFVLVMTLVQRQQQSGRLETGARRYYESVAFEVCCAAIDHYTSWTGLLNSATFDTSMVAYCALCIVQSIGSPSDGALSDWSMLRLATLQELVSLLQRQAEDRHRFSTSTGTNVVDAMARRLSREINLLLVKSQQSSVIDSTYPTRHDSELQEGSNQDWIPAVPYQGSSEAYTTLPNAGLGNNGNVGGLFLSDPAWQQLLDETAEPAVPILDDNELEAIVAAMPSFDMSWWAV